MESENVYNPFISKHIAEDGIIKPWLVLGPVQKSVADRVTGLTLFENPKSQNGREVLETTVEEVKKMAASWPFEGKDAVFFGENLIWKLGRRAENYLQWGKYSVFNNIGGVLLATTLYVSEKGMRRFCLQVLAPCKAVVFVNNHTMCEILEQKMNDGRCSFTHEFEAMLEVGENKVMVLLLTMGRSTKTGFCLRLQEGEVEARIPLPGEMSLADRSRIEETACGLWLERDLFYPEHSIGIYMKEPLPDGLTLRISLLSKNDEVLKETVPDGSEYIFLCKADELKDGNYRIECRWNTAGGLFVTEIGFDIWKFTPVPKLIGSANREERRVKVLETYASRGETIWAEVSKYALGRFNDITEATILNTCEHINARKDCSDFIIQGLLRLLCWEKANPHLQPELVEKMKSTVLNFKYWVDEPGDTVMYMGSENHRILFHTAEWLAGQLYPLEIFANSGQNGLFHILKGRTYITEWIRQHGRFGFDEFLSPRYFPVNVAPLMNIFDFAISEEYKLKEMARQLLDYMLYTLAEGSFDGMLATAHGRTYGIDMTNPDYAGTAATGWLLYGEGSLWGEQAGIMSAVSLATGGYAVPEMFEQIACDRTEVIESFQRQGIIGRNGMTANLVIYRTPDYMLSALQDFRKGEFDQQLHVANIALEKKAKIFWSCPNTMAEGSGLRPDYWSGNASIPRVVQYKNVLGLVYKKSETTWMSHCFFDQSRFDEIRFEGNWAFVRINKGFVGIYSQNGMKIGNVGQYAGRELLCEADENVWFTECGREAYWGSFDKFVEALSSAEIQREGDALTYCSPSVGVFTLGWENVPLLEGKPIQTQNYPLISSNWAYSAFGSGEMRLQYGGEIIDLWFNQ